jgi:hypothetical protein
VPFAPPLQPLILFFSFKLLLYRQNYRNIKVILTVGFVPLSSRNVKDCSGLQDSRELLQSPQSGQTKGQKGGQRLSQSFRLGELSFQHLHAVLDAASESHSFLHQLSFKISMYIMPAHG